MDPGIADFERMAALHWQGTEQAHLGDWLLRAAGGFTGRANSALPLGDPGMPAGEAVAAVEAWYSRRGLVPMIVIATSLEAGAGALDGLLAARGWTIRDISPVMVMTARSEVVAGRPQDPGISFSAEPGGDWLAACRYRGRPMPRRALPVLLSAPSQVFASVRRDGRVVATGRLSVAGGWAGLTAIAVEPAWRRAGLGTAITAGLAARAAALGAAPIFLQVEAGNTAARALYARCGFADRHRYHYRLAPPG